MGVSVEEAWRPIEKYLSLSEVAFTPPVFELRAQRVGASPTGLDPSHRAVLVVADESGWRVHLLAIRSAGKFKQHCIFFFLAGHQRPSR